MNKEWEVKFESLDTFQTMDEDKPLMIGKNAAKNFIRSLLASQRETLAVEIEEKRQFARAQHQQIYTEIAAHIRNSK